MAKVGVDEQEQPLSPNARLFQTKNLNCCIIATIGCRTLIDVCLVKSGLENTLIKHPRFSSLLVTDDKKRGGMKWIKTKVNVENHIINPSLDANMDSPDKFVENYISFLSKSPLSLAKPLWEIHILNVQTSDASSIAILKIHHSIGDGMSLMSLFLACTRKTSDPDSLPTIIAKKKQKSRNSGGFFGWLWCFFATVWWWVVAVVNTMVDVFLLCATATFLKDDRSLIKGGVRVELTPKRFLHRVFSLDDVKLIKNATNTTINDVILGVTQAGLSCYLSKRYGDNLPQRVRLRSTLMVNIRPTTGLQELAKMMAKGSKVKWGSWFGYIIIPFKIGLQHDDPLKYVFEAKAIVDRKKHSFEALCSFLAGKFVLKTFGVKVAAWIAYHIFLNTTLSFSNMMGPQEDISFYGHPLAYIAPTAYGHPQALTIHWQSFDNKMTIAIAADEDKIPNPHQLCDDIENSLKLIKNACINKVGLVQNNV